jgi:hypothetical protein
MESQIKGLAKGLMEEVIKADMSMQAGQIDAWARMAAHSPKGENVPKDLLKGFPKGRYLSLNEVKFEVHMKPVPIQSFWQRIRLGTKIIFGRSTLKDGEPNAFDFCSSHDSNAQTMNITVKRLENGNVKANYGPADEDTAKIMNK